MLNTKDITFQNYLFRLVIYGASGTGKTRSLDTFPKPIRVFDFDSGLTSLRGRDIDYTTYIDEDPNNPTAWMRFEKDWYKFMAKPEQYKSCAIDSFTWMQSAFTTQIQALNGRIGQPLEIQHWGIFIMKIEHFMKFTLAHKIHLIVTAHEKIEYDKQGTPTTVRPFIYGKALPDKVLGLFDLVFHAEVSRMKGYQWRTKPDSLYQAKDRLDIYEQFEPQDYKVLIEKLKRGGNK